VALHRTVVGHGAAVVISLPPRVASGAPKEARGAMVTKRHPGKLRFGEESRTGGDALGLLVAWNFLELFLANWKYPSAQQQQMMMAAAAAAASAMGGGNNNDAPPAPPRSAWANHHNNAEYIREMRIPQKAIGRGGETIKRLKDELSTFVQVDQTTSEQGFSTFKISGATDESVEAAVSYLKGVVLSCEPCECLYPDDVEDEVEVPADKVGTVIGPQGCVLDEIRRRSGCRVQLQPVAVEDGSPRSAKVVGNADAVRACVDLLNDVISGAFDVSPVIKRQKAHYQRIQAGVLGGGGKGKGKGKGGGGGGYWNTTSAAATAGGGAMGGGGPPPHPLPGNAGGAGGLGQQQNPNYTASMGFVPQVMYSPQQMFAANQGMLSPHVMPATTANPGGPIPPYLISMYAGYQQQQQPQRSPSGGPGVSATEVTRQLQQQQQRSAPQPAATTASAATNNQYVQQQQAQQQQPLNVPMSPQGVITPQQVMAVHEILRREHHHQQQNQQAPPQEHGGAPETAASEANLNGESAVEGGREEPS
ncbi:hypothetical protein FOZ62_025820, partial [Perkinsus olseni]